MLPSQLTIEVLDRDLVRRAQVPPQLWTAIKCVSILRGVGSWEMSLPADSLAASYLTLPGSGILITGPDGELFSGPVDNPVEKASQTDPAGTVTFSGPDFNTLLADAQSYPTPTSADVGAQSSAYDVRKGAAETVIRGLVDANIGPSAPAARRARFASLLTLQPDAQRGQVVTISSRFDQVLTQAATAAKTAGLGFRIVRPNVGLQLQFFEPEDRSKQVRLDLANGRLTSYEHSTAAPLLTRVVVGGQGEGADRTFIERTSPDAIAAEAAWGRRIERFKDQRNTNEQDELEQAGDDLLADGGATTEQLKLTPTDDETMRYQQDWYLGDYITAVIRGREIPQVVTQVVMSISKTGVLIGAIVGDPDPIDLANLQLRRRVARLETRI